MVSCDPHGASRLSAGDSVQGEARDGGQASPWHGTPCICPELRAPKGPTSPMKGLCFMLFHCYREILFFLINLCIWLCQVSVAESLSWHLDSLAVALGLSSCGTWAQLLRGMWDPSSLTRD